MGDNEVWCRAWRLLIKHGTEVDTVIAQEIKRCVARSDQDGADDWCQVLAALDDLR